MSERAQIAMSIAGLVAFGGLYVLVAWKARRAGKPTAEAPAPTTEALAANIAHRHWGGLT